MFDKSYSFSIRDFFSMVSQTKHTKIKMSIFTINCLYVTVSQTDLEDA